VLASIDPALREEGSPEPPATSEPLMFAIEKAENLIGRHSRARGIEPEVALDFDDAVSHRHAILARLDDGSLTVRDIGSANGTRLNGRDLEPLTDAALKDGDELTLGHWTRLQVKAGE
jgi:pSer/pThr/pTyr-binding forkhead associated (FHA) protein